MIRYRHAHLAAIEALVNGKDANWISDAKSKTQAMMLAKQYSEGKPYWSDVKHAFMEVQYSKCVYCERPLGSSIEQDVEHFRPKNLLKAWPARKKGAKAAKYSFTTGGDGAGYYWLAYELGNYAAACKDCNTIRKSNYFPIAGAKRGVAGAGIAALNKSERPFLVFPLGTVDDDPEELIVFEGITAVPKHASGRAHARALVTIEFFKLNEREELISDRFRAIREVFLALSTLHNAKKKEEADVARRALGDLVCDAAAQSSCARCFVKKFEADPQAGWRTYLDAEHYVRGRLPKRFAPQV